MMRLLVVVIQLQVDAMKPLPLRTIQSLTAASHRIRRVASKFGTLSITAGCGRAAIARRAAAFAFLLGAGLPFAAQAQITPMPFSGTPISVPGSFEAENFDLGGEGVAYHDNVPGNAGGQYRLSEDVDIILSSDALGGGYAVNNFETGEWLAYTINVAATAQYDIELRASNNFSVNVAFHIEIDGKNVTGIITVPTTGSWSAFQWMGKKGVSLAAGQHVLKVVADQQYFNLNSIRVLTAPPSTPFFGTPIAVPGTFEAENFDLGGEGVAYHDNVSGNAGGQYRLSEDVDIVLSSDALGGGYAVNNFETGEWLNYTINVQTSALYDIEIRASNNFSVNVAFHIEMDGQNVTGIITVPTTGSWNAFQWVGKKSVPLAAGRHVLKIVADQQYFNLNSIRLTAAADAQAPSVPANLTATVVSSSQIDLSWSAATDNVSVSGYNVYRNGVQVANVSGISYSDTGLSAATAYSYAIAAYGAAGNASAQSGVVSATTRPIQTPYSGTPISIPGTFEAENFDLGGEGVAYHDNVPGNAGGQYRLNEDVDIILSSDALGGGYAVNNFETGEWLAYTVNVAATGQYDVGLRVSSMFTTSAFHIEIDGVNVTGSVLVPNTGSWSTFQWVGKQGIALAAGTHVLKVVADQQYFNLNSISAVTTPVRPASTAKLLFSSGFEGSVALGALNNCFGTGCWQDLIGIDSITGFAWPPNIWGGGGQHHRVRLAAQHMGRRRQLPASRRCAGDGSDRGQLHGQSDPDRDGA